MGVAVIPAKFHAGAVTYLAFGREWCGPVLVLERDHLTILSLATDIPARLSRCHRSSSPQPHTSAGTTTPAPTPPTRRGPGPPQRTQPTTGDPSSAALTRALRRIMIPAAMRARSRIPHHRRVPGVTLLLQRPPPLPRREVPEAEALRAVDPAALPRVPLAPARVVQRHRPFPLRRCSSSLRARSASRAARSARSCVSRRASSSALLSRSSSSGVGIRSSPA